MNIQKYELKTYEWLRIGFPIRSNSHIRIIRIFV